MLQKIKNIFHLLQSLIAQAKYRFPSRKLKIIGVTGTDGKTTTTSMIYHILKENGFKVGMISTLYALLNDKKVDTGEHVTTPEPWDLPRILDLMKKENIEYVVLESTSSGLDQNRLFGIKYDSSIITNIGHDHLDYHKTWENYAKAKFKIAKMTDKKEGRVWLNKDHVSHGWLEHRSKMHGINIQTFSTSEIANTKHSTEGIKFVYHGQAFSIPIIGEYNFSNALGAIKLSEKYLPLDKISNALKTFKAPTGRMEVIKSKPFVIIIDFAHTPSSLEKALESVQRIRPNKDSRIITIFGCAGERDKERRKMGSVSAKLSDITIVSIEDPRIESLEKINTQIIKHAEAEGAKLITRFKTHEEFEKSEIIDLKNQSIVSFDYESVQNRKDAIRFAFKIAKEGDIVFITGKGHEKSLAIGNPIVEYPYTDHKAVKEILSNSDK